MALAPASFTALKMALAVPGTPANPVLQDEKNNESEEKNLQLQKIHGQNTTSISPLNIQ